jgi:RNAse (barnase) inhibitor barstar
MKKELEISMSTVSNTAYLIGLVTELSKLPVESEWVEFKRNHTEPQKIGEYISALSNSATLLGK